MNPLLFISIILPILFQLNAAQTYYVDESNTATSQTGSFTNPFPSIDRAYTVLGAISCELVLLGSNASISTVITFGVGSNYTIRPDSSFTSRYFPINLLNGANIKTTTANLTFQNIQFRELNPFRAPTAYVFQPATGSRLTFQSVLIRDIKANGTSIVFCRATARSFVNITDCRFRNNTNVGFVFAASTAVITGSSFTDLDHSNAPLMLLGQYVDSGVGMAFKNNTFRNIIVGNISASGFIACIVSKASIKFEDFNIKNLTMNAQSPFLYIANTNNANVDTPGNITGLTFGNGVLDTMVDNSTITGSNLTPDGNLIYKAIFIHANGPSLNSVQNFTVSNVVIKELIFIMFYPNANPFLYNWSVLPMVDIKEITMKNCKNVNFVVLNSDTTTVSNVYLDNISIRDVKAYYGIFTVFTSHAFNVNNLTANNVSGQVIESLDVLSQNFSDFSLNDMATTKNLSITLQNLIQIAKMSDLTKKGLDIRKPRDTYLNNINLNGFQDMDGMDYTKNANNTYIVYITSNYGTAYLTNSVWHNNQLNGLLVTSLPILYAENISITSDPMIPMEIFPQHRGFGFVNIKEMHFKNLHCQNNQNFMVFGFRNIPRNALYKEIIQSQITFDNISIVNNTAVLYDPHTSQFSLFIIYSPIKPANVLFSNSYFFNNSNLNGLINSFENNLTNIQFINNTFDNNYALQSGAIFSSRNMRQQTSALDIINNTFTNNRCGQNGGVYSFILTDYTLISENNTYINNTAALAGGVGYALRASFAFMEQNSVYLNSSAGTSGGAWFLSFNNFQSGLQGFEFYQSSFVNSAAQRGGSIYLEAGSMTLKECTFQSSKASESGGDMYVSIGEDLTIMGTTFAGGSASKGSFLYVEEIDGNLSISNIQVRDIYSNNTNAVVLTASSGTLNITDSVFENITSPLFLFSDINTSMTNIALNQISCPRSSNSFCLLKATLIESLKITNASLTNINSNVDLISLYNCSKVLIENVSAQNMLKVTQENLDQIFALNVAKVKSLDVSGSSFTKIGFSGVKTKDTPIVMIQNSTFSNSIESSRLLVQSSDLLSSAKLSQPIQFLVLDTCNSTLNGVSFIENSFNSLVNGGAIQILGIGGAHQITDCIFENNQASNGGALYAKNQAKSLSILNSQFNNNKASKNGGALFFPDQSVKDSLLISRATFLQNNATLGGGIYLGNQAITVDSSSFMENNALQGGGIATSTSSKTTMVELKQSIFERNSASQGAALIAMNAMNLETSTSSFAENTAVYGGAMTSIPTSLRLRIYYFDSYFLYLNDITLEDLFSHPSTSLIYDSTTADASELIAITSGSNPNLLFEVTILDAYGKRMGLTNEATGEFKVSSYKGSTTSSNLVGLLGSTKFAYSNSTAYIWNAFSVKGPFDTTVTLSINGSYISQSTNTVQNLPTLMFPVVLDKCAIGQIYDKSKAICSSCSSSTYSLADPFSAKSCQKCLDNTVCLGGAIMYPAEGYWRMDAASENLVKCPQTESCLGGSKDGGKNISLTGFCGEGYEGVACSSCAPGYAKFGSNQSCENCKESKLYYIMFGGYLLIQALAVISTVKINLSGSKINTSSKKNSILQSTLIKIVIDFVQILTLASEFNFNFPQVVGYLYDGVSKIVPTNVDALSVDCFIALEKGNNKHIFFNKVLVILAEPFAYMIFAYIAWVIIFKIKKRLISGNPDFKAKMSLTTIVIIYILQPGIIKIMFELFNCKNYGSATDPKYHLVYDVDVQCWKSGHLLWGLCIAIPTLIFGLLAPFAILVYWTKDKDLVAATKVQKMYTFIFKSYQNNALFWEAAILARKVILILISVFITSQYLQAYLGFLLLALYFHSSYKLSPYNNPQLNVAEAISLASSAFILYSGLYFARSEKMDTISYMLFALDIISGITFIIYSLYVFFRIFKNTAAKIKQKTKIISEKILHNLKTALHSHAPQQFPISIQSDGPADATGQDGLTSERILSSERPLKPLMLIPPTDSVDYTGSERRGNNSYTELPVVSPSNMTGVDLLSLNIQLRGLSIPANMQSCDSPGEEEDFQEFSEILENEIANSPPASVNNKTSKVLKFSKATWNDTLSKKSSQKSAFCNNS